jgi:hypothetical protein
VAAHAAAVDKQIAVLYAGARQRGRLQEPVSARPEPAWRDG